MISWFRSPTTGTVPYSDFIATACTCSRLHTTICSVLEQRRRTVPHLKALGDHVRQCNSLDADLSAIAVLNAETETITALKIASEMISGDNRVQMDHAAKETVRRLISFAGNLPPDAEIGAAIRNWLAEGASLHATDELAIGPGEVNEGTVRTTQY